ncbi:hypothetical protein [Mesorhizobium sp. Z1-4]|uniref:Nmad2 family putative nucleotide modification protein n=1 Tax=Mesorhizobium sp. Z1-4 TaxID=2448478 RepID=UPI000FDCDAA4|nr:hypothetical protein [Mesorhizobium sp. Z1-4]
MAKVYMYVVARDFGFAPNPFHGVCTLATCKPKIRGVARPGDWIVGMGGAALNATGKCIYFMQVSGAMTFNEYWNHPDCRSKRPVRNGSRVMMVGDNIYHRDQEGDPWTQEDSHHSKPDGTPELSNIGTDTSRDRVLYSNRFVYFGANAPMVPENILQEIGYTNVRAHRTFEHWQSGPLLQWIEEQGKGNWNMVLGDPFQFRISGARYSKEVDRIV